MESYVIGKRMVVVLAFCLLLQLIATNTCLGKTLDKKFSDTSKVRKRYHEARLRNGPPLGSLIYILGHLNSDDLEDYGLSVSTRSSPSELPGIPENKRSQPLISVPPSIEDIISSQQQEQHSSNLLKDKRKKHNNIIERNRSNNNDNNIRRTSDFLSKWIDLKNRIKRHNKNDGKVERWNEDRMPFKLSRMENKSENVEDASKKTNRELEIFFQKMNFMKLLQFPAGDASFSEISPSTNKGELSVKRDDINNHTGKQQLLGKDEIITPNDSDDDSFISEYETEDRRNIVDF